MYTGIIQGTFPIVFANRQSNLLHYAVKLPANLRKNLILGASVAVDGVCQTVCKLEEDLVYFDAIQETLRITTLDKLQTGDLVNIERSAVIGQENGGHQISGHVDGKAKILRVIQDEKHFVLQCQAPQELGKYLFNKGFLAVHGASLTLSAVKPVTAEFELHLIPETLRMTNFDNKKAGDDLNLEVERQTLVMVDTLERVLEQRLSKTGGDL